MELKFDDYPVYIATPYYLLRATFQPRGEFVTYLNDERNKFLSFKETELMPLAAGYQVKAIKQPI